MSPSLTDDLSEPEVSWGGVDVDEESGGSVAEGGRVVDVVEAVWVDDVRRGWWVLSGWVGERGVTGYVQRATDHLKYLLLEVVRHGVLVRCEAVRYEAVRCEVGLCHLGGLV